MKMKMLVGAVAALSLSAIAAVSYGATMTLNSVVDTWMGYGNAGSYNVTPRGTDTTINVRSGSSATSGTTSTMRMVGVLEFDLNQLPAGATITDAHVQMFMPDAPGSNNTGTGTDKARLIPLSANTINGQTGLSFGPSDIDPNTLSLYTKSDNTTVGYRDNPTAATSFEANDFITESFGWYNYGAIGSIPQNTYAVSSGPSANDLAYIQGVYNDSWKKLGVMLDPQSNTTSGGTRTVHFYSSTRDTGPNNDEYRGAQLVVTYDVEVPEPSSFVLLAGSIISGVVLSARRQMR